MTKLKKKKKNGEKGNWFSFQCWTAKSVWITFCNELSVTWFACLQLEILWGTFVYLLLRKWFFLSYVLWSRLVTRVTDETWQRELLLRAWSGQQENRLGCFEKSIMTRCWHDGLVTKKPNWIFKSSLLALTLKPKLIYLHRLLNVLKKKTDKTVLNLEQYLYGQ